MGHQIGMMLFHRQQLTHIVDGTVVECDASA